MKQINKEIEKWIKPYATIVGESIEVEEELRETNPSKYFVQLTIPNNFEKYAIALHSYWINYNIPKENIRELNNDDEKIPEEEYTRIKWKDFFEFKQMKFELNSAIISSVDWETKFPQMNNELYPGEGLMDEEHLESLAQIVLNIYGDEEIEIFYHRMTTTNWDENKLFEGRISKLQSLKDKKELNFTPSLIYPKNKKWIVNTDFDLAFSTIGGDSELIHKLIKNNPDEIYEVEY